MSETTKYLVHHGIAGQKWGHRNGPPYPIAYEDHSMAEKKANSRAELTGDKKTDKKIVKATYNEAKYAKAASLMSKKESERAETKAMRRDKKVGQDTKQKEYDEKSKKLSTQSKKAEENAKYFSEKYQRQAKEFAERYGKDTFKNLSQSKIDNMSLNKASQFIASYKPTTSFAIGGAAGALIGGPLGGAVGGAVGGGIQGYRSQKEYRKYLDTL